MVNFLSNDVWSTIKKLSAKAKHTKVAVAYFGNGGAEQLSWKKGDTLIVALSIAACKAGQVDPFELQKLYDRGIKLFAVQNLHAKIFLFDKKVIVGSSNVSSFSKNWLVEAAVQTDDAGVVLAAEAFIAENSVEKIEQDFLEVCKKNYRQPKVPLDGIKRKPKQSSKGELSRLWVISTQLISWTETDEATVKKEDEKFKSKLSNRRVFEVKTIKWPFNERFINQVQEGDTIIEIERRGGNASVLEPKKAMGVTRNTKKNLAFLRVEEKKSVITKSWSGLERKLRTSGVTAITKNSVRQILNEDTKRILLGYFS